MIRQEIWEEMKKAKTYWVIGTGTLVHSLGRIQLASS